MKVNKAVKKILVTALIILAGFFLCHFFYLMLDYGMNGFVRDWFDRNFVYHEWNEVSKGQEGYYTQTIRWSNIKELAFEILLVAVLALALVIRLSCVLYGSWREKKVVRAIGLMINDFMRHNREASEVFPAEYAEVSLQMAEIKAAMQRQEQLQKEEAGRKNDLITYLAHDLKTPLTSVVGYLSLLDEAEDMPGKQKAKYIHITLDKAKRLEKLINEFFEITRYNLQQIILEKEDVDLHFMLIQMADEFYPILSAHGNTIRLDLQSWQGADEAVNPERRMGAVRGKAGAAGGKAEVMGRNAGALEESITVYADGEKLARVFNNILKNAIAYSYPNTEILVKCIGVRDTVYITFSNRGKTIPAQKLDAIFEKFFRLDDARSTNSGGAGLGLAIAKDIVTLHGGSITADSVDEVTTFTVELPRQK